MSSSTSKIDLHCHTTASDGIKSPTDLIEYAKSVGISTIAITDHDTISGIDEALKAGKRYNVQVIPGIEFSIDYHQGSFHLLGLFIDHTYKPLIEKVEYLAKCRETRSERIVDDLIKHNITISNKEIQKEANGGSIGRPHIARVLIKQGYAKDMKEVFSNFLIKGKPGYIKKEKIQLADAFSLIEKAGGISILAHPISLEYSDSNEFDLFLNKLIKLVLNGIEVYASMHCEKDIEIYSQFTKKYDLLMTGGSDFHGDKGETLGYYCENKLIPATLQNPLKNFFR